MGGVTVPTITIYDLNCDEINAILSFLPPKSYGQLASTCKSLEKHLNRDEYYLFWRKIVTAAFGDIKTHHGAGKLVSLTVSYCQDKDKHVALNIFKSIYSSQAGSLQASFCEKFLEFVIKDENIDFHSFLDPIWRKIISSAFNAIESHNTDLSLIVSYLEHIPKNPAIFYLFAEIYLSYNISTQEKFCNKLLEFVRKDGKRDLHAFIIYIFNYSRLSKVFRLAILEYMNLIEDHNFEELRFDKKREIGLVPNKITPFNRVEVDDAKFISTITINPKQKFEIGELVAVFAKVNYKNYYINSSFYFGIITRYQKPIYTIALKNQSVVFVKPMLRITQDLVIKKENVLKSDDPKSLIGSQLKYAYQIGKLSPKSTLPNFCQKF